MRHRTDKAATLSTVLKHPPRGTVRLGDTSYDRLRLKLNENVSAVRDKLIELPENGSDVGGHRVMTLTVASLSVATLTGVVIGLAVARLCASD